MQNFLICKRSDNRINAEGVIFSNGSTVWENHDGSQVIHDVSFDAFKRNNNINCEHHQTQIHITASDMMQSLMKINRQLKEKEEDGSQVIHDVSFDAFKRNNNINCEHHQTQIHIT